MKELFDYFEGLDEAVYISDVDTNRLVFMNRCLREMIGHTESDTYKERKCHEVLQGSNIPCSFCNNSKLEVGKFVTWSHENPFLNQTFQLKDTVVLFEGRKYRVEVATVVKHIALEQKLSNLARREVVLNECLQLFFATPNPDESLYQVLEYLGNVFGGDRTYIFEIFDNETISNTCEWCAAGVEPFIDSMRNMPLSYVNEWMQILSGEEIIQIENAEDIRDTYPDTYALLKRNQIHSVVAGAIRANGQIKGFLGINNAAVEKRSLLVQVLGELEKYMIPQIKRRDLYYRFNKLSYQDLLTGAYNYNAMIEHNMLNQPWKMFGALYCDINSLKETNDTQGHDAGNALIQECYQMLKKSLRTEWIYRVDGDEFVALYYDVENDEIEKDIECLRLSMMQSICQVSIGYAWSDKQPLNTKQILDRADTFMHDEKEKYYANMIRTSNHMPVNMTNYQVKLQRFLCNTYCDISFLLTALSNNNGTSYFFFGDMQKNLFFISENMRRKFGFENNIVPDFINQWASHIIDANFLNKFWNDIHALLEKKQSQSDLRYQIMDAHGNNVWVRCFGKIKWNEDGKTPLFFVGRMSQQDEGFIVDTLTNFPAETVLEKKLQRIEEADQHCQAIGFSFHHITQINNNHGRSYGDSLIRGICDRLSDQLSGQMTFYRLSGMRCLALMDACLAEQTKDIIFQIRAIIDEVYQQKGIRLQYTCSFACMSYPQDDVSPQDFIENMLSLIKVAHQSPTRLYIDDSMGDIEEIQKLSNMESNLMRNIIDDMENFRIVVQPVVATEEGIPIGGETLLRWRFQGKEVSPGIFIPIVENEHMIARVGRWVFEQAVQACIRMLTYAPDFYLTVNVSLQQLDDEGFVDFIRQTLDKYQLDGGHIVLELTESCMDDQPERIDQFVKACGDMNIRIALDDFGSGYSSLRVLLRYPSSIIKLDRSLLLEMSDSYEKNGFITSVVYACHQFGKKVCMEGVETDFQYEIVKESGCDLIQGFYYYKPMELDNVCELLGEQYGIG